MQTEELRYRTGSAKLKDIEVHLHACKNSFIPPLNTTVDISDYSKKIHEHAVTLEAWIGAKLIGLIAVYCNNIETKRAFITNVSVLKEYAGRGISSQLLMNCIGHVTRLSFKDIVLEVNKDNGPAIALYKRFGFTKTGEKNKNLIFQLIIQK